MSGIDDALLETLLHMEEGGALDFKRDQYPFAGATDEQKAELVKDVVAFANAWKTAPAHILVGVDEVKGARGNVVGVAHHLDDASVQQIVNSKTSVPVQFEYIAASIDGLPVGVIRISQDQERPIHLVRNFGGLKKDVVYVRRGSSTDQAGLDEIIRMVKAGTKQEAPRVQVEFSDPDGHAGLGSRITVVSSILRERPRPVPTPEDELVAKVTGRFDLHRTSQALLFGGPSSKAIAEHKKHLAQGHRI